LLERRFRLIASHCITHCRHAFTLRFRADADAIAIFDDFHAIRATFSLFPPLSCCFDFRYFAMPLLFQIIFSFAARQAERRRHARYCQRRASADAAPALPPHFHFAAVAPALYFMPAFLLLSSLPCCHVIALPLSPPFIHF